MGVVNGWSIYIRGASPGLIEAPGVQRLLDRGHTYIRGASPGLIEVSLRTPTLTVVSPISGARAPASLKRLR